LCQTLSVLCFDLRNMYHHFVVSERLLSFAGETKARFLFTLVSSFLDKAFDCFSLATSFLVPCSTLEFCDFLTLLGLTSVLEETLLISAAVAWTSVWLVKLISIFNNLRIV